MLKSVLFASKRPLFAANGTAVRIKTRCN